VQNRVDHLDERRRVPRVARIGSAPVGTECAEPLPLALGTGPEAGGKRGGLVEKKEGGVLAGGIGVRVRPLKSSTQMIQRRP